MSDKHLLQKLTSHVKQNHLQLTLSRKERLSAGCIGTRPFVTRYHDRCQHKPSSRHWQRRLRIVIQLTALSIIGRTIADATKAAVDVQ